MQTLRGLKLLKPKTVFYIYSLYRTDVMRSGRGHMQKTHHLGAVHGLGLGCWK